MDLDLLSGEAANALTADAEDAAHVHYPLKVEYVGQVPNFEGIYMVVLRLNDSMTNNLGDVLIRLSLHGMGSNRVRVGIGQIGGGPTKSPCCFEEDQFAEENPILPILEGASRAITT